MELLEAVPGTLFLKTLDPDRHLAIPVDFVEIVPGTDGSPTIGENEESKKDNYPDTDDYFLIIR